MRSQSNSRETRTRYIRSHTAAWKYIEKIDFESIKHKVLMSNRGWREGHVERAIVSYKMFLYICRVYNGWEHAPHPSMDEVWHAHILHTRRYFSDCQALFGGYLHHNPATVPEKKKEGERRSLQDAYKNTRRQMILAFGDNADPEVLFAPVAQEL